MTAVFKDAVVDQSTTEGTTNFALLGGVSGYRGIAAAGFVDTNTLYYCARNVAVPTEWEVGLGTLNSGVLERTTVLASSTGAKVAFSAGNKTIANTLPADVIQTIIDAGGGGAAVGKNAHINGDFQIWQEGTSFAAIATGTYFAEMWQYNKVGAMVHTVSRSSDVPTIAEAGRKIPFSVLVDCTTVDSSIAAGDNCRLSTYVEGSNFVHIAGVGLCHQFWHKHTKTGTYCIRYSNAAVDRSFVREYTQAVADTWEFSSVLIDASPTAGTWDYTNGIGLRVDFTLAAGTTFHASAAGAWETGNFLSTANQVNACDNVANNFRLAGVQLEKGSVATEFEAISIQQTLSLCQRYYAKTTASARFSATAGGQVVENAAYFPAEMRTLPTATVSSGGLRANLMGGYPAIETSFGERVSGRFQIASNAAGDCYAARELITLNARF